MGDAANSRAPGNPSQASRDEPSISQDAQHGVNLVTTPQGSQQFANTYAQQTTMPPRPDSFHMASLSGAIPSYPDYNSPTGPRYSSSPSGIGYQIQNPQQYIATPLGHPAAGMPYANTMNPGFHGQFLPSHTPPTQNIQPGAMSGTHFYGNHGYGGQSQQQGQGYYLQQNHFVPQSPIYPAMSGVPFGGRGNFNGDYRQAQHRGKDLIGQTSAITPQGRSGSIASSSGQSSVVRGPPRKPRQSGHAIWIGNLPPQTDLMSLVLHVCKETSGLESLFLISKSNCAFANFKDEASCSAAQAKIHDSRFQTVRLVSRLRRNSGGTPSETPVPAGTADSASSSSATPSGAPSADPEPATSEQEVISDSKGPQDGEGSAPPKDKFFIVKSLTVEDLELSVRNGIWATQSHNEEALNKAYETAENVYLVFSANKSGEYFGYARMISPINDDPAAAIEFAPIAQPVEDPTGELPKAIPTPASEFAPKGRIIDDSARGTIFWEAERDESEDEEEEEASRNDADGSPPPKAWGKPFKVEWISTTRLPFYRTRGLRNPWNSNREVKIARDGTELETSIGKRLLGLFHRVPSPIGPQPLPIPQMPLGYPPHMRGFQ